MHNPEDGAAVAELNGKLGKALGELHETREEASRLTAEINRLHSWAGLMSLLDEHYPAEIFTGESGDEGPRVVALIRAVDAERSSRQAWAAEAARLSWISEFDGTSCLANELHRRVCACITDEQAAQLGPRFSRPVCVVHPTPSELQVAPEVGDQLLDMGTPWAEGGDSA